MWYFLFSLVFLFNFTPQKSFSYVALGDSYTEGKNVQEHQRWTNILVDDLKQHGVTVTLLNLGHDGYPTQYVVEKELPLVRNADIITVAVGVNDLGGTVSDYRKNFVTLLDKLPTKKVVLLTLPDTTLSPQGKQYEDPKQVRKKILAYNNVIISEGKKRGFPVVDIYTVSLKAKDKSYFADMLHPSPKQHLLWEKAIYPTFYNLLQQK